MPRSHERQLADALAVQDPADRLERLHGRVLPGVKDLWDRAHDARALAAAEANDAGLGYRRMGQLLGISTARCQQLVAEGRRVQAGDGRWQPPTPQESVDGG